MVSGRIVEVDDENKTQLSHYFALTCDSGKHRARYKLKRALGY